MKYGDTLEQRSIPEWSHNNVDYDEIKGMIKDHTTPGNGRALSIPGQNVEIEKNFENVLYSVLLEQHERINLFVRSKTGEIERRLDNLESQTQQSNNYLRTAKTTKITAKRLERYGRLENNVLRAGNEIRFLSRFVGAQRLAFDKLLKKYRKWTRSEALEQRFKTDLNRLGSFSKVDFDVLLTRWAAALHDVRAPFQPGFLTQCDDPRNVEKLDPDCTQIPISTTLELEASQPLDALQSKLENLSGVDFDTAFATIPRDVRYRTASYWVHNDNMVELQILLLQHLQIFSRSNSNSPMSHSPSTRFQRRPTNPSDLQSPSDSQNYLNTIAIDDPDYFVKEQDKRPSGMSAPAFVRLSARYFSSSEVIVSLQPKSDCKADEVVSSKLKLKRLRSLLDTQNSPPHNSVGSEVPQSTPNGTHDRSVDIIRRWIMANPGIKPLAGVCSKRTRYTALSQDTEQSLCAVLDRDISMASVKSEDLSDLNNMSNLRLGSQLFPHAVLSVRQVGRSDDALLHKLDHSHLVERIDGFAIEVHAVWECCEPQNMQTPHWIPMLKQDIRKVPVTDKEPRKRRNSPSYLPSVYPTASTSNPSAPESSVTAVSVARAGPSNAASRLKEVASRSHQKGRWRPPFQAKPSNENGADQRYWNEYDDIEDGNDDAYVIWVDPRSGNSFKEWFGKLLPSWRRPSSAEDKSLPSTHNSSSTEDGLPDDSSSTSDESAAERHKSSSYGTFNPFRSRPHTPSSARPRFLSLFFRSRGHRRPLPRSSYRSRRLSTVSHGPALPLFGSHADHFERYEHTRRLLTLLAFSASIAILAVTCILATTGRHKQIYEVDAGIVFGIVVNLLLACVGLGCLLTGHATSWVGWCCGLALFGAICVGNGGLCAWLVS